MYVRLQKYLADCGIASRRKAEELIQRGRVKVNGETASEPGLKIDPEKDVVLFGGKEVKNEQTKVYVMLNKPIGYITTARDQFGRPTVMDLIKDIPERVFPVGRLDYETSGLVLLTNDGDLAYKLTHPKHVAEKVYIARITGLPSLGSLKKFRQGLKIEDYTTAPAGIELLSGDEKISTVKITLREGRNRQVRNMCEAIGHRVVSLRRVSLGSLSLGNLPLGKYRKLTKKERDDLSLSN